MFDDGDDDGGLFLCFSSFGERKVACSAEGANFLLEAGVVERLAESEGMARASQVAAQSSKLGALGASGGDVSDRLLFV